MIVYEKFFETLKKQNRTQYSLIHNDKISPGLLNLMRRNRCADPGRRICQGIQTKTLAKLCTVLHCQPQDIIEQDLENDVQIRQAISSSQ